MNLQLVVTNLERFFLLSKIDGFLYIFKYNYLILSVELIYNNAFFCFFIGINCQTSLIQTAFCKIQQIQSINKYKNRLITIKIVLDREIKKTRLKLNLLLMFKCQ